MIVEQIRKANFKYLLDTLFQGNVTDFARALDRDAASVHRYVASHKQQRDIGSKAAREIETRCRKPVGWLDRVHIECEVYYPEPLETNVKFVELPGRPVPVLRPSQIEAFVKGKPLNLAQSTYVPTSIDSTETRLYAISLINDSMAPRFPEGTIVIAKVATTAEHGDFVIATDANGDPQFKQFVIDGSDRFLKPLNPQYPTKPFTKKCEILGIILEARILIQ